MMKKMMIVLLLMILLTTGGLIYLRYYHGGNLGAKVTEEMFGADWPLSVSEGYANCVNGALIFQNSGVDYALTPDAESNGYRGIKSLLKRSDDGSEMELDPLIAVAKRVCL